MARGTPHSMFLNQILIFQGVYNAIIGDLQTHYEKQVLTVNISSASPHSFYKGKPYMSIEVMDNSGRKTYERVVEGLTTVSFHEVPMREGFIIKVFHLEAPARLICPDGIAHTGVNRTTHRFLVTRYGLKNLAIGNSPLLTFMQKLNQHVGDLRGSLTGSDMVRHVLVGARSLPQPYRTQFVMKYNTIMSECFIMFIVGSMGSDNGAQGTLAITSKPGIQNLVGSLVELKSGEEIVLQDTVQPYTNLFNYANIPYGVYSVEFHSRAAEQYIISPQYVEVRDNINPVLFDFIQINGSLLVNDIPLEEQMNFINGKANEIAQNSFRLGTSLYLSDEKKLLLAAIRSLPADRSGLLLNKFGGLFNGPNGARRDSSSDTE